MRSCDLLVDAFLEPSEVPTLFLPWNSMGFLEELCLFMRFYDLPYLFFCFPIIPSAFPSFPQVTSVFPSDFISTLLIYWAPENHA